MIINKMYAKIKNIEESQERLSLQMEKIAPIVEEFHANKLLKKKIAEKTKFFGMLVGVLAGLSALIGRVI